MTNSNTQAVHMDTSWGFDPKTACGKSTHVYHTRAPKNVTTNEREVTCKRCQSAMKKG